MHYSSPGPDQSSFQRTARAHMHYSPVGPYQSPSGGYQGPGPVESPLRRMKSARVVRIEKWLKKHEALLIGGGVALAVIIVLLIVMLMRQKKR